MMSSFGGLRWLGALVFLFGAASAVYPPLKLLVGGSVTTSLVIAAAGMALIILPALIVGHEVLILAVASGVAGTWFLAHRHGQLRGRLDANHNGIDDRVEELLEKMKSAKP